MKKALLAVLFGLLSPLMVFGQLSPLWVTVTVRGVDSDEVDRLHIYKSEFTQSGDTYSYEIADADFESGGLSLGTFNWIIIDIDDSEGADNEYSATVSFSYDYENNEVDSAVHVAIEMPWLSVDSDYDYIKAYGSAWVKADPGDTASMSKWYPKCTYGIHDFLTDGPDSWDSAGAVGYIDCNVNGCWASANQFWPTNPNDWNTVDDMTKFRYVVGYDLLSDNKSMGSGYIKVSNTD